MGDLRQRKKQKREQRSCSRLSWLKKVLDGVSANQNGITG